PDGDSLRIYTPFRSAYGRSNIRFCLAQRTVDGLPTTGVTRTTNTTTFNGNVHPNTIVPAWNTQMYLNIWVVDMGSSGVLGYSYQPGTWGVGHQNNGFIVDYRAFGAGPGTSAGGYHFNSYNGGKTGVHEIGHFFNLSHTWGPNNSGNPTCTLTDNCEDTPPVNGPFTGCANNGPVTSTACPEAINGAMWQNHMDYANDACMLLFTAQQVARMEAALSGSPDRSTLVNSNGCQPVNLGPDDAGITSIVQPFNGGIVCTSPANPVVRLRNYGTNALTSVSIILTVNGTAQPAYAWTGNLAPNATVDVTVPSITLNPGNNTISATTILPNGVADTEPLNDGPPAVAFTLASFATLPLLEGFDADAFPPPGWRLFNPDGDFTWERSPFGRSSIASLWINNFDEDGTDHNDDLRTSPISTSGITTLNISFDLAHKYFPNSSSFWDTLSVLVSKDCGASYETVYKKWGPDLATAGSSGTSYNSPAASDW
ncbi:MAG TPA: M43 family zinc metalloprotease, partial [Chitinophagaceae bacterium]|nr:M43 family zinc metalloprotease [Chitinophagaceae bacterium]